MLNLENRFIVSVFKNICKYPFAKRTRILNKILQDISNMDIFSLDDGYNEDENYSDLNIFVDDFVEMGELGSDVEKFKEMARLQKKYEAAGIVGNYDWDKEDNKNYVIYGRTALHNAILKNDLVTIEDMLISGEGIFEKDNGGNTPLQVAQLEENFEAIKLFRKYGIQ